MQETDQAITSAVPLRHFTGQGDHHVERPPPRVISTAFEHIRLPDRLAIILINPV